MSELVLMGDPRVAAIPAVDCGEELVDLREATQLRVLDNEKPHGLAVALLRRSLAERLQRAEAALPDAVHLLLVEGYRPYEVQRLYFDRHRRRLQDADPGLTAEASYLSASQFVSPPDVAPHVSGAAIDLTLVDDAGRALDMGTPVDATPEESRGACYFAAENISSAARDNRATLAAALEGAGLVNYPTEWWHWSYGDRYWALTTRHPEAIFGPVRL